MSAHALVETLRSEGGTLAECVAQEVAPSAAGPAQLAASGPRAAGHAEEYELLLEMIVEGSRLHYGAPRVLAVGDPDLALLLGDRLYALGLSRLAELGDLEAVSELADIISLVAQTSAAGDHELTAAVWEAGAVAIGWGADPAHEQAKIAAREGRPDAVAQLGVAATRGRV